MLRNFGSYFHHRRYAVEPGSPAAAGALGTPPVTPAAPDTGEPAWVSRLEKTFQSVGNQLAAFTRVQTRAAQPPADAEPTAQQAVTLKSLKAELDARDAKIRDKAIRTEIKSVVKSNGIPADAAPFFEAFIEQNHKSQISVNERDEVVFKDSLGEEKPFEILGQQILKSPGGASFLPAVSTPGAVGGRNQQGVTRTSGGVQVQDMTAEQMQKDPAAALEGLRQLAMATQAGATTRS